MIDCCEALERTVNELDVLRAIYGNTNQEEDTTSDENAASSFCVISPGRKEMKRIRRRLLLDGNDDDDDDDDNDDDDDDDDDDDNHTIDTREDTSTNGVGPEFQIRVQTNMDVERINNNNSNNNDDSSISGDNYKDYSNDDGKSNTIACCLIIHFRLPIGYPEHSSAVVASIQLIKMKAFRPMTTLTTAIPSSSSSLSVSLKFVPLTRSAIDDIIRTLNDKAESILGTESILDLIEDAKYLLFDRYCRHQQNQKQRQKLSKRQQQQIFERTHNDNKDEKKNPKQCSNNNYGRRWIWVHHITSTDRRKSIVREARSMNLTGILKYGYPGVILINCPLQSCQEFTSWIKGNKSRPGGFGRNWGHHVRGEINYYSNEDNNRSSSSNSSNNNDALKQLSSTIEATAASMIMDTFEEMDDLSGMAKVCKEMGLEEEFKQFVMQHK